MSMDTHAEAIAIIDLFEDLLDRFDITVPSPGDEEDRRANDNAARLYGYVYGDLCDEVEARLKEIAALSDHDAQELEKYRKLDATPEELDRIIDAYGRGMTLREENGNRLEIIRKIKTDRLKEITEAEEKGHNYAVPFSVGDLLYGIRNYRGYDQVSPGYVSEVYISEDHKLYVVLKNVCRGHFGERVFLTKEETAEAIQKNKERRERAWTKPE